MSAELERPRLRPYLAASPERDLSHVLLWDRLNLGAGPQRITTQEFGWVQLFDGSRTLAEIHLEVQRQSLNGAAPLDDFRRLTQRLDEAFFLDSPRFREKLKDPTREPSCIGCYPADPDDIRKLLHKLFTNRHGPGLPEERTPDGSLRGALIPHIDYTRGGRTFAWGFKEVAERTDASLFVIIGTSHYSAERFTLTRKNFKTPLGIVLTDQEYIDKLAAHYGPGLFDDELAHLPEHSIELEVVFLQYLYEKKRDIRIVPLVVGSFQDCVYAGGVQAADVRRMITALQEVERETKEPICYLISGDLAHIGPKFGDPERVAEPLLGQSRDQDKAILEQTKRADPAGYFKVIAAESDRRRICGLPPTYTFLEAFRPTTGQVLDYDQYVHPHGNESVSFASVAFYGKPNQTPKS